jgi:hypothetical protein
MVSFTKCHQTDFDQLMSFNHFLSTGKILKMFFHFARQNIPNFNLMGILFAMTIDLSTISAMTLVLAHEININQ